MLSQSFILVLWLCTFTLVSGQVKSCGHPGDAPNADFHHEVGDDFVLGAKVVYECRKGHVMVSRTNHRNCLVEGWDNVIPVCEVGCQVPHIWNGWVHPYVYHYKENQSLNYYCKDKYKRAQVKGVAPLCTKAGDGAADWSPTPDCEKRTCELGLAPTRGSTYTPADKTVFLPEETVTVDCAPEYWIIDTHESSDTVWCDEYGRWSSKPECEKKTCGDPDDRKAWRKKLRETHNYICGRGYKARAQYATCTKDGWTPNPLCEEIICDLPIIPNAVIINPKSRYHHNDVMTQLDYSCKRFYKPMGLPIATCKENGWDNIMTCSEIKCELGLAPTRGSTYAPADKTVFLPEETVRVDCAPEYWTIGTHESSDTVTCQEGGQWSSTPGCEAAITDFSSAFNTIIPSKQVTKLRDHGFSTSLCNWILDLLVVSFM